MGKELNTKVLPHHAVVPNNDDVIGKPDTSKAYPLACGCTACVTCYHHNGVVSWYCTKGGFHWKLWKVPRQSAFWPLYESGGINAEVVIVPPEELEEWRAAQ